jgi:rare lipoprotein A (peptidoglycan hydrolase)
MIENQTKQLKLNVTNIKSFLIKKNSEARSLRIQKRTFLLTQQKQEESKKKEKKIESSGIKTTLNKITSSILSGPMSLFDKIMNFAGTILLGVLLNNLPSIIKKIQKFFSNNKWIIDGVKFLFKALSEGVSSVIGFISGFSTFVGATQQQIIKQRDNITREIENLSIMVGSMDVSLFDFMKDLGKTPTQQRTPSRSTSPQRSFQNTSGYGRYAAPATQVKPQPVRVSNPSTSKPKGYARGGEVTKGSQVRSGKVSSPRIKSQTFTQGETGRAKAARQSVNYFEVFKTTTDNFDFISKIDEENNKKFEELAINIKSIPSLFDDKDDKDKKQIPRSPKSPGDFGDDYSTSFIPGNEIIGFVGSTGRSTGPHIHIETGNGYGGAGGSIPSEVLSNIIVGKKPLSSWRMGDGIGAGRNHKGFDYEIPSGTPIQLKGGLKFSTYDSGENAGYGNVAIIKDSKNNSYLLGHLSAGPASPEKMKELEKKQKEKDAKTKPTAKIDPSKVTPTGSLSGEISWYGPGFYGNKTADGTKYTPESFLAAHKSLPFGTLLRITWKGKSIVVPVKDRGPYISGRVVDLSNAAAEALGMKGTGVIPSGSAKIEVVKSGPQPAKKPVTPVLPPPPQKTSLNIPDGGQDTRTIVYMINQKEEVAVPFPMQFPVPQQTVVQASSSPSLSALWM